MTGNHGSEHGGDVETRSPRETVTPGGLILSCKMNPVPESIDQWSDQHWDRSFARQTSQVETVKLLVTFSLGIAGTMVATALQVSPPNAWDLAALVLLAVAFLLTLVSIGLDRLKWPSRRAALDKQADEGWDEAELLVYLRGLMRDTEEENDRVVRHVRHAAEFQVLAAAVAAGLAVTSLLR
jgi:hypothetical protein